MAKKDSFSPMSSGQRGPRFRFRRTPFSLRCSLFVVVLYTRGDLVRGTSCSEPQILCSQSNMTRPASLLQKSSAVRVSGAASQRSAHDFRIGGDHLGMQPLAVKSKPRPVTPSSAHANGDIDVSVKARNARSLMQSDWILHRTDEIKPYFQEIVLWREVHTQNSPVFSKNGLEPRTSLPEHHALIQQQPGANSSAHAIAEEDAVPERRAEMYFRAVSVTMYCVMWLSIQTLIAHTCLAFARNADELSGNASPSKATLVLAAASRISPYAPVMSMLFLANRMRVLALTHGLGDPTGWVKGCEVVSCIGFAGHFFLILITGSMRKDKPQVERLSERTAQVSRRSGTWRSPLATLMHFVVYGGLLGVASSMLSNPDMTKASTAVTAAAAISIIYFVVEFSRLGAERLAVEADDMEESIKEELDAADMQAASAEDVFIDRKANITAAMRSGKKKAIELIPFSHKLHAGLTAASSAAQKAPMLSILFLAARMRHLQVSPPEGIPPPFVREAFIAAPWALAVEILVSSYVGWTGKEELGYYRAKVYRSSWYAHLAQHCSGFIALCTVGTTMASIFFHWGVTSGEPLSTTMLGVLALCMLYFSVHGGLWVGAVARDILTLKWQTFQNTLSAASISVAFSPMLCVLFVACRVRALQISEQKGNLPRWTQDCVDMTVCAVIVQFLCCLALPIFSGRAASVDSEGNVLYDMRPMVGAYAVTVVKYLALFLLHGGIAGVCCAIFIMTPDTTLMSEALRDRGSESLFHTCIRVVNYTLLALILAFVLSSAKVIGLAIKFAIESVDEMLLGIHISVSKATLCVCRGFVNVQGLVASNPADHGFTSDCLLKVANMRVKINMGRLMVSTGKVFEITEIAIEGVELNYEKSGMTGSSNVKTVLNFIEGTRQSPSDPAEHLVAPAQTSSTTTQPASPANAETTSSVKVDIKHLLIKDMSAQVVMPRFGKVAQVNLGELDIDNVMNRLTHQKKQGASEIVIFTVQTILKSAVSNVEIIGALAKEGAKQVVTIAVANAKACSGGAVNLLCGGVRGSTSPGVEQVGGGGGSTASSTSSTTSGKMKRRQA